MLMNGNGLEFLCYFYKKGLMKSFKLTNAAQRDFKRRFFNYLIKP
jgi:hypothetical protein